MYEINSTDIPYVVRYVGSEKHIIECVYCVASHLQKAFGRLLVLVSVCIRLTRAGVLTISKLLSK